MCVFVYNMLCVVGVGIQYVCVWVCVGIQYVCVWVFRYIYVCVGL